MDGTASDQVGHKSRTRWMGPLLQRPVCRIVSLVPSLTEAVFQIGAGDRLVGRTDFCVRPADSAPLVEAVGGTKNPRLERIHELEPDVILANKEENTRKRIEALAADYPVWLTDPQSPQQVPGLWKELGRITGLDDEGRILAGQVADALGEARRRQRTLGPNSPRFIYYIWKKPCMAAGHGTYISNLLEAVGFRNGLPQDQLRFPKIPPDMIRQARPDIHIFSDEPYPFELPGDLEMLGLPGNAGEVVQQEGPFFRSTSGVTATLVDAQQLSWYPSLTAQGLRYAGRLLEEVFTQRRRGAERGRED